MPTVVMLTPADHGRLMTPEEFDAADWQDGYRYELIDGRLSVSPAPEPDHDFLVEWLGDLLGDYARRHPDQINHLSRNARIVIPGRRRSTQPQPDLTAYRDFPRTRGTKVRWADLSPVLVVEVLSPDNPEKDLERNVELYERVPSVREYWVVDTLGPELRLRVYRRRGRAWQRPIDVPAGATYTSRFLPGFTLLVDPRR